MIGKETTEAGKPSPGGGSDCCPASAPKLCELTCTPVATDPNNCGGCGVTCGDGQDCVDGLCSPPPSQCKKPTDCASTNTDCRTATACKGSVCSYSYAAINTPVVNQTPGDCQTRVCDGAGNIITVPDSTDRPAAQGECYSGSCSGVTPVQRPKIQGAFCSGGICDGNGACVECVTPADCAGGSLPNATVTCEANTCGYTCNAGYSDCPGGCINTDHDIQHCGSCDTICSVANGTASCIGGMCHVDACNPGFGNCNGDPSDGCETNVTSSPNNCGACGIVCSSNHGTPSCNGGACQITCATGWGNCNGAAGSDGCETNVFTDPNNCGQCGNVCFTPNGTASCTNGQCGIASCNAGFADCNGNLQDGCEIDLNTDFNNCGACLNRCATGQICANHVCISPAPEG
jgi:hypothetical protein